MKMIAPLVMLIAGLALGAGTMTLYWSGQMTRCFHQQSEWKLIVDKQRVAMQEQGDALRNLTVATRRLLEATGTRK